MKNPILSRSAFAALTAIAALAPGLAGAADAHRSHAGHAAMHPATAPSALGDGIVKKIDKAGGKLTIAHDALPNGMPAMTMAFKVRDPAWLEQLRDGQKIRFASESVDGAMTVVRLEVQK